MASVDDITQHIDSAAPRLDDSLSNARAAVTDVEAVVSGLMSAKSEDEDLAGRLAGPGGTGRAGEATSAASRAEELTGSTRAVKATIDTSVDRISVLKNGAS